MDCVSVETDSVCTPFRKALFFAQLGPYRLLQMCMHSCAPRLLKLIPCHAAGLKLQILVYTMKGGAISDNAELRAAVAH